MYCIYVVYVCLCGIAASLHGQDHDRERERERTGLLGAFLAANARKAAAEESSVEPRARSGLPRPVPGPGRSVSPSPSPAVHVSGGSGSVRGLGFGLGSGLSPQETTKTERAHPQGPGPGPGPWQATEDFLGSSGMARAARRGQGKTQTLTQAPPRWPSRPKI
jgi:hypothetical protein